MGNVGCQSACAVAVGAGMLVAEGASEGAGVADGKLGIVGI